jgi:mono/diheme cytochrome c family protein
MTSRQVVFALIILAAGCSVGSPAAKPVDLVKRGEYLVTVMGCNDCHSRDLSGLGRWTEEQFVRTLRTGRVMGEGRRLLPPMPWFNTAAASDEDLRAIYAYLRGVPAGPPAVAAEIGQPSSPSRAR